MKQTSGQYLRDKLGLKNIPIVKIARVVVTTWRVYMIFFDSRRPRMALTRARILSAPMPSMLYTEPFNMRPKILPFIDLDEFTGNTQGCLFFVVDLAGYFQKEELYTRIIESKENISLNVKNYYFLNEDTLQEFTTIDDLKANAFSDITMKHYAIRNKDGNKGSTLHDIYWNEETNKLTITFKVVATFDKPKITFRPDGSIAHGEEYTLKIQFQDPKKYLGTKELYRMQFGDEQQKRVLKMLRNDYVKVWSSDPSHYYQGGWEGLSRIDADIYPFPGPPGKDIWINRHGLDGLHLNKHFKEVFAVIYRNYNDIANMIAQKV